MPDNAGLYQMMRQHRHCEPGGAADLNRVCIGRANAEMLGEDRRKHDMRRDGRITAEDAVDVCSRQAGIGNRKLGGLAHEVEGGRALMPAECRQSDAGDEAHGNSTSFDFVIPGWSEGPDPESRDSPMCNCTSEVRVGACHRAALARTRWTRPGMTFH